MAKSEKTEKKVEEKLNETLFTFDNEFDHLVKSMPGILWVDTLEEERFIEDILNDTRKIVIGKEGAKVEPKQDISIWLWSFTSGLNDVTISPDPLLEAKVDKETTNPMQALDFIINDKANPDLSLFILRGLGEMIKIQPTIGRKLKDIYKILYKNNKIIIITATDSDIPISLDKNITYYSYKSMSRNRIETYVNNKIEVLKGLDVSKQKTLKLEYKEDEKNDIINAFQGLGENEMRKTMNLEFNKSGEICAINIIKEKKRIIEKSGVLQYWDSLESMDNVGGLSELKSWLKKRKNCLTDEARTFGLPVPRGVLFVGPPGVGKSLCAKAVSWDWKLPLIRMDIGKIMGSLVGQSEQNIRKALDLCDASQPCVTEDTIVELDTGEQITIKILYDRIKSGEKLKLRGLDPDTHMIVNIEVNDVIQRDALDKELLEIELEDGNKIKVTENHKLLVKVNNKYIWKEASALTMSDDIVTI
jgi:hypothetical protein